MKTENKKDLKAYYDEQLQKVGIALSLVRVLKESLVDDGELNTKISICDTDRVIDLIDKNLEQVSEELVELSLNSDYLLHNSHINTGVKK